MKQLKRYAGSLLATLLVLAMLVPFAACGGKTDSGGKTDDDKKTVAAAPVNGGFESADLSGWTIEWGDAFDSDCVSSEKTFTFENDAQHQRLDIGQTGNWYLTGKGFHGKYAGARTGAIRSTVFTLAEDGIVSFKLAGGAPTVGKGGPAKAATKLCYLAIYRASDDRMIGYQTNTYFVEHTEDYEEQ